MHIATNRKRTLHKGTMLFLIFVLLFTGCSSINDGYRDRDFSDFPPRLGGPAITLREYRSIHFDDWVNWDAFVSYDMLCGYFGDFYTFAFGDGNGNWDEGVRAILNTDSYRYQFVDKDNIQYGIDIAETSAPVDLRDYSGPHYAEITDVPNKNDLRTAKASDPYFLVYYYVGDIRYEYGHNGLSAIEWVTKNHHFTLHTGRHALYDLENGSFIARLMREDTAEAAVEEFNAHISRCLALRSFCRHQLPWILVVVVSCATIGTVYLILRRKKKKKTAPAE